MLVLRISFLAICIVINININLCDAGYNLVNSYSGNKFFNQFNFQTSNAGYSQMLNESEAMTKGLINVNSTTNQVYIGVDYETVIEPGYPGRPSVYLRSKILYNEGLFITSFDHIPQGCGVQPQFWMEGLKYGTYGEIMMLTCTNTENVTTASIQTNNQEICNFNNVTDNFNFTGKWIQKDCSGSGYGCPIMDDNINSCGIKLNQNNGGYYAMQWVRSDTNDGGIKTWFWNKNENNIPTDITSNSKTPDPSTFGEPFAGWKFGDWCNHTTIWNQTLTIDLQFCGYSAQTFEKDGCVNITGYTNCEAFVANNPDKFKQTYWLIDYINVYQQQ